MDLDNDEISYKSIYNLSQFQILLQAILAEEM